MARNKPTILIIILIPVILVVVYNNVRAKKSRNKQAIESAIKSFESRQSANHEAPYDSAYAKKDTVSFYRNGSFIGKSVIVTE